MFWKNCMLFATSAATLRTLFVLPNWKTGPNEWMAGIPSTFTSTSWKRVAVENVIIFAGRSTTQTVVSVLSLSVRLAILPIARSSFFFCTVSSSRAVWRCSNPSASVGYHAPPGA